MWVYRLYFTRPPDLMPLNKNIMDKKRSSPHLSQLLCFCLTIGGLCIVMSNSMEAMGPPLLDAQRYADYALNLHDHRVFGLSGAQREHAPSPSNANSPLYPLFVATVMKLDNNLALSIGCELANIATQSPDNQPCATDYTLLSSAQVLLSGVALIFVWLATYSLFGRYLIAWAAGIMALCSTKPIFFAHQILTENLVLVLFAALMCCISYGLRTQQYRWWVLTGVSLALLTLTRPEYLYLTVVIIAFAALYALSWRARQVATRTAVLTITVIAVLSPWSLRNHALFASYAVTGGYGDTIVAYRSAYNRMTLPEWQAAFIYWLPGHGESLANKYLAKENYAKLGTDANSYLYKEGTEIFANGLAAVGGDRAQLTGYLIKTEILDNPVAHIYSSIPLAWRGVLAGKYLAVLGLPSFIIMLLYAFKNKHWQLIGVCFPALFMIVLYAAISVSIPRYNIYLIFYYGISIAWVAVTAYQRYLVRNHISSRLEAANQ